MGYHNETEINTKTQKNKKYHQKHKKIKNIIKNTKK